MRETSTSLRIWFGVIAIFYFVSMWFTFNVLGTLGLLGLFAGSWVVLFNLVINTIWALVDLYVAFALPKYLNPDKAKYVEGFLLVQFGLPVVIFLITGGYAAVTQPASLFPFVVSALVTWYLYRNVQRLSFPPTAPVKTG